METAHICGDGGAGNNIGAERITEIAEALEENSTITRISLLGILPCFQITGNATTRR